MHSLFVLPQINLCVDFPSVVLERLDLLFFLPIPAPVLSHLIEYQGPGDLEKNEVCSLHAAPHKHDLAVVQIHQLNRFSCLCQSLVEAINKL